MAAPKSGGEGVDGQATYNCILFLKKHPGRVDMSGSENALRVLLGR